MSRADYFIRSNLSVGEANDLLARFDLYVFLQREREWSERTFGSGQRIKSITDHIRKELVEIEGTPTDLKEWLDVVTLALDGAWRAGYSPHQIIDGLLTLQERNEKRQWPDWRTIPEGIPVEHVRDTP